jgi:ribose transport system permease protein
MTAAISPARRRLVGLSVLREYGIVVATVLLFLGLALTTPNFLSSSNLSNILDQQSTVLIVAVATTFTIITGGFDVSLSAIFILCPLVTVRIENATGSTILAVVGGVAVGLLAGGVNAVAVNVLRVTPFIATLATSFGFFGVAYLVSKQGILTPKDLGFRDWSADKHFGLTGATWIAILVVAVAWFVLARTTFGRYVYAAGGNPESARLAGVRVALVSAATFIVAGAAAGLAGSVNASQTLSAQASDDFSFAFAVVTAVIVGGTSIAGGEGTVWRTIIGVFFIAMLGNAFNLNGIDPVYQRIIQGVVILAAVSVDSWTKARRT